MSASRKKVYLPRMDAESIKSDAESLFKDVVCVLEATYNEQHLLWLTLFDKSEVLGYGQPVKTWEQEMAGHTCIIGEFGGMPINLCFFYAKVNGRRVCFWECVSMVSHSGMIEKWMAPRTKHVLSHSDATNFHNCLGTIRDLNQKAA